MCRNGRKAPPLAQSPSQKTHDLSICITISGCTLRRSLPELASALQVTTIRAQSHSWNVTETRGKGFQQGLQFIPRGFKLMGMAVIGSLVLHSTSAISSDIPEMPAFGINSGAAGFGTGCTGEVLQGVKDVSMRRQSMELVNIAS